MKNLASLVPLVLLLGACSGTTPAAGPAVTATVTATATVTTTATATATTTTTVTLSPTAAPSPDPSEAASLLYPSGDPIVDGYPVLVDTSTVDSRVQNRIETAQVVALAPGVYAAYTEIESDLAAYMDGPSHGDCAVWHKFFPNSGGSCWSGVQPGSQEP